MPDKNEPQETPFNMAMLFYIRLNKLMNEKDTAAIYNNVPVWYNCLRAIYRNIKFKLSPKERKFFDGRFQTAKEHISTRVDGRLSSQVSALSLTNAAEILDEIDAEIMIKMDRYKMIFPNFEATAGLKRLEARYGLGVEGGK